MDVIPLIAIMGPTGAGKSAVAMALAAETSCEIISEDSMQVYRGLDIGTAKPSKADQAAVPHHLLDILDISQPLDVFTHVDAAWRAVSEIRSRGKIPVAVGGSGLYMRGLIHGLDAMPSDKSIRDAIWAEFDGPGGLERIQSILSEKDPASLCRIGGNFRRLARALEVVRMTGRPMAELWTPGPRLPRTPVSAWNVQWERPTLSARIAERTDAMLGSGWTEEAETMINQGLLESPTAWQAIGYAHIGAFLQLKSDWNGMRDAIVADTRKYARRQTTWFNHQHPEAKSLHMPMKPDDAVRLILEDWRRAAG